jgi:histidine phosphotransferase ChpT
MRPAELTALLGSRICHDLISPLGAIGNGVELLAMSGAVAGPEMSLISESIDNASARIRFFRVAFGAAGADHRIGREEVLSVLGALSAGGRLAYAWTTPADLSRREVKLAFLVLMCVEAAMPWGGRVTVTLPPDGGPWAIIGEAPRLRFDPPKWAILAAGDAAPGEVSASDVQFLLAPLAAEELGRPLQLTFAETEIAVRF